MAVAIYIFKINLRDLYKRLILYDFLNADENETF